VAIATIVTRGFGNGTFNGSIALVVTRGYSISGVAPPAAAVGGGRRRVPIFEQFPAPETDAARIARIRQEEEELARQRRELGLEGLATFPLLELYLAWKIWEPGYKVVDGQILTRGRWWRYRRAVGRWWSRQFRRRSSSPGAWSSKP